MVEMDTLLSKTEENHIRLAILYAKYNKGKITYEELQQSINAQKLKEIKVSGDYENVINHRLKKKYEKAWNTILMIEDYLRLWLYDAEGIKANSYNNRQILKKFGYYYHLKRIDDIDRDERGY